MTKLFFFYFLLSGFIVSAQDTSSKVPEKLVQITTTRYQLKYPVSWTADTSRMFGVDLLIRSPKVDSLDKFVENMNVFVQDLTNQNYTLLKMGKESEVQIKNIVTDVEIIESRLDSSSTIQYYALKYRGRQGKFLLTTEQRYFLKDNTAIALTFTVEQGKERDYQFDALAIFDSFGFL